MKRRVAITGLGVLSGCGAGAQALWSQLVEGSTSIRPVARLKADAFPCRLAAEVNPEIATKDYVPKSYRKAVKVMARDTELAVISAALAVKDAGLTTRVHLGEGAEGRTTYPSERLGCQIGAGLIPAEVPELAAAMVTARVPDPTPSEMEKTRGFTVRAWGTIPGDDGGPIGGMNNLPPLWLLKYLPNMLACHVTILHGAEGPSNTHTCSEASGLLSLGETCRVIERDAADICFSGGAESKVNLMGTLRSTLLSRLATAGPETPPADVLRPYDGASKGTLPGEGAGILIAEETAGATARGARMYAIVAGFGAAQSLGMGTGRTYSSRGLVLAIRAALRDAGIQPGQIDAIVPQALGLAGVDAAEAEALREVFGERLSSIPVIAITPVVGDCAAGHGALQAAVGALALHHQTLPSYMVLGTGGPTKRTARAASLTHVLACTGSLAGQNAAVVLAKA